MYEEEILDQPKDLRNSATTSCTRSPDGTPICCARCSSTTQGGASADQVEIQREMEDGTFLRINAPQMTWEGDRGCGR